MPDEDLLRVFVSHSSEEDQAVLNAIASAFQARADTFTLLMDTVELKAGDAWRARINLWLGACDAAVLVLSEQALGKPWVLYEAAILSYRNRGGNFKIIPVLLNDPEGKLLKDRRLDAPQVSDIQAVRKTDPAEIAAEVIQKLEGYKATQKRPISAALSRILTFLDKLPTHLLENASAELKLKLPWEPGEKPLIPFAERLLGATTDEAAAALAKLEDFHRTADPRNVRDLIELVAASWVDPKAVDELPEIARAASRRAVALNAALADTARMYQVAACPSQSFFISLADVFPEPPHQTLPDEIVAKVEAELCSRLNAASGKQLRERLKRTTQYVVFAAVPTAGFTDVVVERLQTEFPTIAFFFLTADQGVPAGVLERDLAKLIIPQLHENEESLFNEGLQSLVDNVEWPLQWKAGGR